MRRLAVAILLTIGAGACESAAQTYAQSTLELCEALEASIDADYPQEQTLEEATRLSGLELKVTEAEANWNRAVPPEFQSGHDALADSLHPPQGRREVIADACFDYLASLTIPGSGSQRPVEMGADTVVEHLEEARREFLDLNDRNELGEAWLQSYLLWTEREVQWAVTTVPECMVSELERYRASVEGLRDIFRIGLDGLRLNDHVKGQYFAAESVGLAKEVVAAGDALKASANGCQ